MAGGDGGRRGGSRRRGEGWRGRAARHRWPVAPANGTRAASASTTASGHSSAAASSSQPRISTGLLASARPAVPHRRGPRVEASAGRERDAFERRPVARARHELGRVAVADEVARRQQLLAGAVAHHRAHRVGAGPRCVDHGAKACVVDAFQTDRHGLAVRSCDGRRRRRALGERLRRLHHDRQAPVGEPALHRAGVVTGGERVLHHRRHEVDVAVPAAPQRGPVVGVARPAAHRAQPRLPCGQQRVTVGADPQQRGGLPLGGGGDVAEQRRRGVEVVHQRARPVTSGRSCPR